MDNIPGEYCELGSSIILQRDYNRNGVNLQEIREIRFSLGAARFGLGGLGWVDLDELQSFDPHRPKRFRETGF